MQPNPYKPPRVVEDEDAAARLRLAERQRIRAKLDDNPLYALVGYGCGIVAFLTMFNAYGRQMYPPGRHYGDPELFVLAAVLILVGIPASCLQRIKWPALSINLLAAAMVAATWLASFMFGVNFPPFIQER